jgi:predicted phage terminase large subunit-like protein
VKKRPAAAAAGGRRVVRLPRLSPLQAEIAADPSRFKLCAGGRRLGKSVLCGVVALTGWPGVLGALNGGTVWLVSPSHAQNSDQWRWLRHAAAEVTVDRSEVEKRLELVGGGVVMARSGDDPSLLRGAGLTLALIDEAAYIPRLEELWNAVLRPALSDKKGGALIVSTPRGCADFFYRMFESAKDCEGWRRWQAPSSENPRLDRAELEATRRQLGSFVSAQEVDGEFVNPAAGLVKRSQLRSYTRAGEGIVLDRGQTIPLSAMRKFVVADLAIVAKASADWTCVMTFGLVPGTSEVVVLDVAREHLGSGLEIAALLRRVLGRWGADVAYVESVSFSTSLIADFVRGGLPVKEVKPGSKEKHTRLLAGTPLVEQGLVYVPAAAEWLDAFLAEVTSFPAVEHDDQVDCLAYGLQLAPEVGGRRVADRLLGLQRLDQIAEESLENDPAPAKPWTPFDDARPERPSNNPFWRAFE